MTKRKRETENNNSYFDQTFYDELNAAEELELKYEPRRWDIEDMEKAWLTFMKRACFEIGDAVALEEKKQKDPNILSEPQKREQAAILLLDFAMDRMEYLSGQLRTAL